MATKQQVRNTSATFIRALICHQCGQSSHMLTSKYDENEAVNGTMVTMREPYKSYMWYTHPGDPGVFEGDILCAFCEAPLFPNNVPIIEEIFVDANGNRIDVDDGLDDPPPPQQPPQQPQQDAPPVAKKKTRRKKSQKNN